MKTSIIHNIIVLALRSATMAGVIKDPYSVDGIDIADYINSNSMSQDNIEAFIGTDKAIYRQGEDVRMFFKLTNLRQDNVTVACNHSLVFHFFVQKDEQIIWRQVHSIWSWPVNVELPPGEALGRTRSWDMMDDDGNLVGIGTYDVVESMDWGVVLGIWDPNQPPDPADEIIFAENPKVPITIIPFVPLTGNRGALDSALQQIANSGGNPITTAFQGLQTSAQISNAYDQLSGQSRPPLAPITTANTTKFAGIVSDRMRNLQVTAAYNLNTGPLLAMAEPKSISSDESTWDTQPNGYAVSLGNGSRHFSDQKWGIWGRGYGVFGDRKTENGVPGYHYTVYGTSFGFDYKFTEKLLFGITGGCSDGDVGYLSSRDKSDVRSRHIGLYGSWNTNKWYLDSVLTYTGLEYETERYVDLTREKLEGNFDGHAISGYFEAGLNWQRKEGWFIQPLTSFQFSHLALDGYTETGGVSSLTYDSQNYESYQGSLGMKVTRSLYKHAIGRGASIQFRGRWIHEFGDNKSNVQAYFASDPGATFTVSDVNISRDSAVLGTGLSAQLNNNTWLSIDYDARLNVDDTAHIISGSVVYKR